MGNIETTAKFSSIEDDFFIFVIYLFSAVPLQFKL